MSSLCAAAFKEGMTWVSKCSLRFLMPMQMLMGFRDLVGLVWMDQYPLISVNKVPKPICLRCGDLNTHHNHCFNAMGNHCFILLWRMSRSGRNVFRCCKCPTV